MPDAPGKLAPGGVHEIRNPLNLVQNFPDGSGELCTSNGRNSEETAGGLTDNLKRFREHGDRANQIVHHMLAMGQRRSGQPATTPCSMSTLGRWAGSFLIWSGTLAGLRLKNDARPKKVVTVSGRSHRSLPVPREAHGDSRQGQRKRRVARNQPRDIQSLCCRLVRRHWGEFRTGPAPGAFAGMTVMLPAEPLSETGDGGITNTLDNVGEHIR